MLNTHGMLSANQQQMRQVWPFLADEPPVLLDWLPWSHTFGGNHDMNLVLTNGGTLWIDDGRPAPGLVERTVRNLADARPTIYLNVPAGYAALLPHLERDPAAARAFLDRLRLGFFAAAALPQQLWDRLEKLASDHGSADADDDLVGTDRDGACRDLGALPDYPQRHPRGAAARGGARPGAAGGEDARSGSSGPNVTPGYTGRPDLTEAAFDEEGFFRTGDAVALADPDDPAAGLLFRGRIAEDFKLSTGTFVSVGTLRPRLLSASQGLLTDAVICGENGDRVTALVWLTPDAAGRLDDDGVPGRVAAGGAGRHHAAAGGRGRRLLAVRGTAARAPRTRRARRGRDHRQGLRQPAGGPRAPGRTWSRCCRWTRRRPPSSCAGSR